MIVIRLTRVGKKKQPSYRLVVQQKSQDPWGKAMDYVGQYNPRTKPKTFKYDEAKIKAWIAKGATCSPTLHNLLVDAKVLQGEKVRAARVNQGKKAEAKAEAKPAEEKKA